MNQTAVTPRLVSSFPTRGGRGQLRRSQDEELQYRQETAGFQISESMVHVHMRGVKLPLV